MVEALKFAYNMKILLLDDDVVGSGRYCTLYVEAGDLYGATHLWDKTIRPKLSKARLRERKMYLWINKNEANGIAANPSAICEINLRLPEMDWVGLVPSHEIIF